MKRVKSRLTVLLAFFAVLAMCLGIAFMPKADKAIAEVNTITGFYVEDGAAARLVEGESGIKWTVHITKAKYNLIQQTEGVIKGIGLEVRPAGVEDGWKEYYYGGTLVFDEAEDSEYVFPYAIYYDDIIADLHKAATGLEITEVTDELREMYAEELAKAYAMNLEVRPFVKVLPAEGNEYNVYGEADDTARSLQGISLAYLVGDLLAGEENEEAKEALLKSFLPGTYNLIAEDYKSEDNYYSNYDAQGHIVVDEAIPMENAKIFYGAKEITETYQDGVVSAAGIKANVTKDGTVSDYITILDTATGNVYKQYFVGLTLAIDEATDLDYFRINDPENYGKGQLHTNAHINYAKGDITFNGYYKVVKNIDATGYTHTFNNGVSSTLQSFGLKSLISHTATVLKGMGLTGTFDGDGHIISNLKISVNGLFGFINGGTVKNVAFTNPTLASSTGLIAAYILNGATLSDIYMTYSGSLSGWNTQIVANGVSEDCQITRLFVDWANNRHVTGAGGGVFGELSGLATALTDSYVITQHPALFGSQTEKAKITVTDKEGNPASITIHNGLGKIAADGCYLDGVAQSGMADKLYAVNYTDHPSVDLNTYNVKLNNTQYNGPYAYTLLNGLKRYTSIDKMQADKANNNFSSWNQEVWEILDGVPTIRSTLTGDYTAFVNGNAIAGQSIDNFVGTNFEVEAKYNQYPAYYAPTLTAISGAELVSINGASVTTTAAGVATIKVEYAGEIWQFTLNTLAAPIALEQEYYYSAHDGQFYDDAFNVVALTDILDKDISAVFDAKSNKLTLADGLVTGADFGRQLDWLETYFVFVTADANYKLSIKAADAIIDEVSDLSIFTLKSPVTNGIFSPEGEGVFDGYYVMVKNIDATGYQHKFAGTTGFNGRTRTYATVVNDIKPGGAFYGKGFTGCFDGNGYTISNLNFDYADATAGRGGLFGIINGGIVENLALTAVNNKESNYSGVFAQFIVGDARISDIYLEIKGDRNDGSNYILADAIQETATFERMYLTITGSSNTALWGGNMFVKETYAKNLTNVFNDCYMIAIASPVHSEAATDNGWVVDANGTYKMKTGSRIHSVVADALYVNGVKNETATANRFFAAWAHDTLFTTDTYQIGCNGKTYEIGSTYSIKIINGLKRYTSNTNFKNDMANNDFSNWTSDVWAVRDGYIPVFTSTLSGGLVPYINGADATKSDNIVGRGQSVQVIPYRSASLACVNGAKLAIVSGSEFVRIEGDKIIGLANGEAVIRLVDGTASKTFTITVINPTIDYERELQFSAHDGVIFDGANVVTVADILGEATNYTKITDINGNILTLDAETGAIKGITTSTKDWEENAILFYFADKALQVNVKVAELIIDEATDLSYFRLHSTWSYDKDALYYTVADDDYLWKGYYVLAKNIDATGYTHMLGHEEGLNANGQTNLFGYQSSAQADHLWTKGLRVNGVWVHGFQGVFDGQGYAISNLTTKENGLFGVVAGGTIKNIAFIDQKTSFSILASGIVNNSKLSNIFVQTSSDVEKAGPEGSPLFGSISPTVYQIENIVIYDNYSSYGVYNWDYSDGCFGSSTTRYANNLVATFGSGSTTKALNNVILISERAMGQDWAPKQEAVVKMDAKYIDGVLNEATYTITWNGAAAESAPVEGVRRYTSQETLTADVANISAQIAQLEATGMFVVTNGVITWKNAPVA